MTVKLTLSVIWETCRAAFPKPVLEPGPAHVCLPNQTPNLVLAVCTNELVSGIRCVRGRHANGAVQGGGSRTGLGSTAVESWLLNVTKNK